MDCLQMDFKRYERKKHMPLFQYFFRKANSSSGACHYFYSLMFKFFRNKNHCEMSVTTKIGGGLYIGHPYMITINPDTIMGMNVNIHKGVTIGQENRGNRKGTPVIGNDVWIGINSTIVGNIKIGDDVLIAPNSFVNKDIPSHSIVYGNPCSYSFREHATEDYIGRRVEDFL